MEAPCKNCGKRELGCHSKCDFYEIFRRDRERQNAERLKRNKDVMIYKKERKNR